MLISLGSFGEGIAVAYRLEVCHLLRGAVGAQHGWPDGPRQPDLIGPKDIPILWATVATEDGSRIPTLGIQLPSPNFVGQ